MKVYKVFEVWYNDEYCGYFLDDEYDMAVAYANEIGGEVRESVRLAAS